MILNIHSFPSPCKIIIHKCVGFLNNELSLLPLWSFSSLFNKMNFMTPPTQRYALLQQGDYNKKTNKETTINRWNDPQILNSNIFLIHCTSLK